VLVTEAGQAHHLEDFAGARRDLAPRPFADLQRVGHVLEDGHVRPHRVGLEHHPHAALLGGHEDPVARGRHGLAVDGDRALVGMLEPGDAAEGRRLAAAARAQQGEDPALFREPSFISRVSYHRRRPTCRRSRMSRSIPANSRVMKASAGAARQLTDALARGASASDHRAASPMNEGNLASYLERCQRSAGALLSFNSDAALAGRYFAAGACASRNAKPSIETVYPPVRASCRRQERVG
jgi:hypothetical protein